MTDTAQERRQSPRAKVVVKVECRSGLRYVLGNLENISDHGMLVSAPETFALGRTPAHGLSVFQTPGEIPRGHRRIYRHPQNRPLIRDH
jgi:hypothetical protein